MAPLLRGLSAEPLGLKVAHGRIARDVGDAMTCARLRIQDALAGADADDWVDLAVVCVGLSRAAVEAVVSELKARQWIELDRHRARRGPGWRASRRI
jgi:hypothetical protein